MSDNPNDLRDVQPSSFRHIIGQRHVTEALKIAVEASFQEGKKLDEVLLCGPPGLGKSALVSVLAQELAVPFTEVLAQSISNTAELNSVLLSATDGILFLDEIHLLNPTQQHSLLQVLDKRRIFLSGGKSVQSIPVAPFTLVGATTDPDGLIGPLIDRFRIVLHLDYYSLDELAQVVRQRCLALAWKYESDLPIEIARRGRQTPRIALRLLQSARRVAVSEGAEEITVAHLLKSCELERVSTEGLDNMQQKLLGLLGPSGQRLNVLASMLGVSTKVLTKTVEPFLLRHGMIVKSDGGVRLLTKKGREHLATFVTE
ncbi:Holliday junction ATP-dependent DNA helicase RuvB [Anatilimnocola aggregata]|uniref:Holliday junction ATP-dependent DNA helicase RuvB n=1 Tax=Anatilimnocola aggregata TaxID=2528021 RepID=A0A517YH31_9BACT|nr:AAA family ATPase [Anatilimnocola aggregata]QDU29546.1 Holliday junction ATP-dependent DNA helicase RuvB [Anatilimnocola aggregata]